MNVAELVAVGALVMIGVILLLLLMQYLRLREIWQSLCKCREAMRWARIWESENRELKRSLRAERVRFEELQRQLLVGQES